MWHRNSTDLRRCWPLCRRAVRSRQGAGRAAAGRGRLNTFQSMLDLSEDLTGWSARPYSRPKTRPTRSPRCSARPVSAASTGNFLGLVARNRRLFAAADIVKAFRGARCPQPRRNTGRSDFRFRAQRRASRALKETLEGDRRQGRAARSQWIRRCLAAWWSRSAAACSTLAAHQIDA